MITIGIAAFCVFLILTLLLASKWIAAIVSLVILITAVELAGFMGLMKFQLNPIAAVILVASVGIAVEFTVHMCLSFLTTTGTNAMRSAQSLKHMFAPIIHGGISTLLGILMLAFNQYPLVVKYFFLCLTAVVLIGIFNGLCLLPVILTYFGPECEVCDIKIRSRGKGGGKRGSNTTRTTVAPSVASTDDITPVS